MKKVVLLACVMVVSGFACGIEKYRYESALQCYKSMLEGGYRGYRGYCKNRERTTLDDARKELEKAKIDLEICLVRKSQYR